MVVGLSSGNIPEHCFVGFVQNSYAIHYEGYGHYWLSGKKHPFEWKNGAIKPAWNDNMHVFGCGILLNSENKLSLFFTRNGILMGQFSVPS
jgi:hypothetical protein